MSIFLSTRTAKPSKEVLLSRPILIIPVRAELDNGNISCLVGDISKQSRLPETVFVVNNSHAERYYESPVWKENCRTITFLKEQHNSDSFVIVDKTGGIERNMGKIRNSGMTAFEKLRSDTALIHLDADCRIAPQFVATVIRQLSISSFTVQPMLYLPFDNDPFIKRTFFTHHLPLLAGECVRLLSGLPATRLGAPQLAATARAWSCIDGFPELIEGEDFEAGRLLSREFGLSCSNSVEALVLTADRITKRGFESAARADRKRDNAEDAVSELRFDNPLFHLASALAAGRIELPQDHKQAVESKFDIRLPDPASCSDEGYSAALQSGLTPFLSNVERFSEIWNPLIATLYSGIVSKTAALEKQVRSRYNFTCGSEEEQQIYWRLAAGMLAFHGSGCNV